MDELAPVIDLNGARERRKAELLARCRRDIAAWCADIGKDPMTVIARYLREGARKPVTLDELGESDLIRVHAVTEDMHDRWLRHLRSAPTGTPRRLSAARRPGQDERFVGESA